MRRLSRWNTQKGSGFFSNSSWYCASVSRARRRHSHIHTASDRLESVDKGKPDFFITPPTIRPAIARGPSASPRRARDARTDILDAVATVRPQPFDFLAQLHAFGDHLQALAVPEEMIERHRAALLASAGRRAPRCGRS
jgi:hypothetical protein